MSDPLDKEILNFSFTVEQTNGILQVLAQTPYALSAPYITLINIQGNPQFDALLEKERQKNESQTASEEGGNQ